MNLAENSNSGPQEIERFNIQFRIQHIILFTTFLVLAFTGWSLKYPEVEYSPILVKIWGGPKMAGKIHVASGITLILDFLYHILYVGYLTITGKIQINPLTTIIPLPKDIVDAYKNILYFLGIGKEKPKFGSYNYMQKFDYWAVFWGMLIIGVSGLALAFPTTAALFIPSWTTNWVWELLFIMHSDEALLAIVFILFWHFYNEHLRPDVFPMSWIWITGKISLEDLKEKHALEYEALFPEISKKE